MASPMVSDDAITRHFSVASPLPANCFRSNKKERENKDFKAPQGFSMTHDDFLFLSFTKDDFRDIVERQFSLLEIFLWRGIGGD